MNSIKIVDDNALMVQLTVSQIKGIVGNSNVIAP